MFSSASQREGGVPQILLSYTDGSTIDLLDEVTNKTLAAGVETITVATAFGWTDSQLLAVAHNKPGKSIYGTKFILYVLFVYWDRSSTKKWVHILPLDRIPLPFQPRILLHTDKSTIRL